MTGSRVDEPEGDALPALRFLTCGSVDDGKSTLIGRLLYEQGQVFDDQLAALQCDTRRHGTAGEALDFSLLVDGLEAEREQGITIDVAYRYFRTARRAFIAADAPGHEQYTRNMVMGASNADLAILLVDARKGLLTQTHRHATIVALLGIRHVVLAVNKIDLVGFDEVVFAGIVDAFHGFAAPLGFTDVTAIPLSARYGDNLSSRSPRTPWYGGPALVEHLETVSVADDAPAYDFRMPVQWINRRNADFRGIAGTIASGVVAPGDRIVVAGSGREAKVARIVTRDGDRARAEAGEAVTLVLADEVDVARGDMLAAPHARPAVEDAFTADLVWMDEAPLHLGRSYLLKLATRTVPARVNTLIHRLDVNTLANVDAATLRLNEVGRVQIGTAAPSAFDPYDANRLTGAFILIDRDSHATAAAGLIQAGAWRATNVHRQDYAVSRADRTRLNSHKPGVVWFTGLSGSGKSTIANAVERELNRNGVRTAVLDGDNVRHGLSKDLGFSRADRAENIRRVAEVARLMTDAGLIVLCCFISPFRDERAMARGVVADGDFLEVFVDTPLAICMERDRKGLYRRAMTGDIPDFTGVDQAYEPPPAPDVVVGGADTVEHAATKVLKTLVRFGVVI